MTENSTTRNDAEFRGSTFSEGHRLTNLEPGQSPIELLAQRFATRQENRIPTPFFVRKNILRDCHRIAKSEGYDDHGCIHYQDLVHLREKAEQMPTRVPAFLQALGFVDERSLRLSIFERAEEVVVESQMKEEGWFYYKDFMFYHTVTVSYWPWMRSATSVAILFMFIFYFATAVFFCNIVNDENICPSDPTDKNRSYYGWLSALYFASTTMSTVGYGDLNVEKDPNSRTFYGIAYMIISLLVAILFFGLIAEASFSRFKTPVRKFLDKLFKDMSHTIFGKPHPNELLYVTIRRMRFEKLFEIIFQFCVLNLIGVFVSRYFVNNYADEEGEDWNWMTSLYWAVQTTTTIGYGDLSMKFEMRWFQIFYLTLSTYLAGNALGRLGSLANEIANARSWHAWQNHEVSKGMIHDFNSDEFEDSVDQYEFAIASLLLLGKITKDDLHPIMDKFRALAGPKGVIDVNDDMDLAGQRERMKHNQGVNQQDTLTYRDEDEGSDDAKIDAV